MFNLYNYGNDYNTYGASRKICTLLPKQANSLAPLRFPTCVSGSLIGALMALCVLVAVPLGECILGLIVIVAKTVRQQNYTSEVNVMFSDS